MDFDYKYLFPFEKIEKGSQIIIYGAGVVGVDYLKQVLISGFCHVVGFIDRNYDKYETMVVPIYPVEKIDELEFDYVVIALKNDHLLPEILRLLNELGVKDDKIVYVFERKKAEIFSKTDVRRNNKMNKRSYAYDVSDVSIAFYMIGAFGDAIIQKALVEAVERLVPDCSIDIYHSKADRFLSTLYYDDDLINELITDAGVLFFSNRQKYKIAFSVRGYFINSISFMDEICHICPQLYERIQKLNLDKLLSDDTALSTAPGLMFRRRIYNGLTCYTGFSYNGAFDISDYHVGIPLDDAYKKRFEELDIDKYITLNYGNGDSQDANLIAKAWPLDRFRKFVRLFKQTYRNIKVVQLGAEGLPVIQESDIQVMGESFELVKHILKNAIFHLDIEGGLVHLASQLGTKCIVLFGPTDERYVGYNNNINIKAGNCHHCYGLYTDINKCARNLNEPECMYSITPELVMKYAEEYLQTIKKER